MIIVSSVIFCLVGFTIGYVIGGAISIRNMKMETDKILSKIQEQQLENFNEIDDDSLFERWEGYDDSI